MQSDINLARQGVAMHIRLLVGSRMIRDKALLVLREQGISW